MEKGIGTIQLIGARQMIPRPVAVANDANDYPAELDRILHLFDLTCCQVAMRFAKGGGQSKQTVEFRLLPGVRQDLQCKRMYLTSTRRNRRRVQKYEQRGFTLISDQEEHEYEEEQRQQQ